MFRLGVIHGLIEGVSSDEDGIWCLGSLVVKSAGHSGRFVVQPRRVKWWIRINLCDQLPEFLIFSSWR